MWLGSIRPRSQYVGGMLPVPGYCDVIDMFLNCPQQIVPTRWTGSPLWPRARSASTRCSEVARAIRSRRVYKCCTVAVCVCIVFIVCIVCTVGMVGIVGIVGVCVSCVCFMSPCYVCYVCYVYVCVIV